jgi:hypothetical protein
MAFMPAKAGICSIKAQGFSPGRTHARGFPMNADVVTARSAIESLRSGVPSRHAAARLGTTQREIREQFEDALDAVGQGRGAMPLLVSC